MDACLGHIFGEHSSIPANSLFYKYNQLRLSFSDGQDGNIFEEENIYRFYVWNICCDMDSITFSLFPILVRLHTLIYTFK